MISSLFGIAVVALPAGIITVGNTSELNKEKNRTRINYMIYHSNDSQTVYNADDLTLRDLTGKEIELLISYRLMTDEEKRQTLELMKQLAADRENMNTNHSKLNTNR